MTNLLSNDSVILKAVTVIKDRKYSQSYSSTNTDVFNYAFAEIKGDWLFCFDDFGSEETKHKISAKHFKSYDYKRTINFSTFTRNTKKAYKLHVEAEKLKNEKFEAEKKAKEKAYQKEYLELKNSLSSVIEEKTDKLNTILLLSSATDRLIGNLTHNEACNRAVGVVGYRFAKFLGWKNVLKEIAKILK